MGHKAAVGVTCHINLAGIDVEPALGLVNQVKQVPGVIRILAKKITTILGAVPKLLPQWIGRSIRNHENKPTLVRPVC